MDSDFTRSQAEVRRAKAEALRQAASIADSQMSPLATDAWNEACRRIKLLIDAEASKLEVSEEAPLMQCRARPKLEPALRSA